MGGAALGDDDAVRTESRGRADDCSQVAWVGDPVEHDDQRRLPTLGGELHERGGVGVLIGVELGGDALVHCTTGQLVELDATDLEQADVLLSRKLEDLADALFALSAFGDVQRMDRHRRAQQLDDRVAACHPLGGVADLALGTRGFTLLGRVLHLVDLVVGAILGARGRALALETLAASSTGTGCGVALAGLLDRALALAVAWH